MTDWMPELADDDLPSKETMEALAAFRVYMVGARFPPTGPDHRIWLAFRAGYRAARRAEHMTREALAPS